MSLLKYFTKKKKLKKIPKQQRIEVKELIKTAKSWQGFGEAKEN